MVCEKGLDVFAKNISPGQPVRTAQAALGRYILPPVNFRHVKGRFIYPINDLVVRPNGCYGSIIMG